MNTNAEDRDINQMDTNTQPESRVDAQIVGGKLSLIIPCPVCKWRNERTVDYRIVEITALSCDECGKMFDVEVQNVFDAGLAARSPRDEEAVEKIGDTILKACDEYRCSHQLNDGDGISLIDALTPEGEPTVYYGREEVRLLADYIAGEVCDQVRVLINASKSPHPVEDEKKNEQARDWGSADDIEASI